MSLELGELQRRVETYAKLGAAAGTVAVDLVRQAITAQARTAVNGTKKIFEGILTDPDAQLEAPKKDKIVVWLVHPTRYRKDGTPMKWKKHILPTQAIGQLAALMPKEIVDAEGDTSLPVEIRFLEDTTQPFDIDHIAKSMEGENVHGIVMFCGVQTNQWPRTKDLAAVCKNRGIPTVAGGFHVRAEEIHDLTFREAKELGMSLAIGEAESTVQGDGRPFLQAILEDLSNGGLKPAYRQVQVQGKTKNPDINNTPLPLISTAYQNQMMNPTMTGLETSRGCPYTCGFCSIWPTTGVDVRARNAENIKEWLRHAHEKGIEDLFIVDDNFAKNDRRFEILQTFIDLQKEGIEFGLMIQVDLTSTKGPKGQKFMEMCQAAGVYSVFLGVESVNPQSIKNMHKPQNHTDEYPAIIKAWHDHNVLVQCGYIIGNPEDRPGVGRQSARALLDMGMDIAAAYIRTPLPGSLDFRTFHEKGYILTPDVNSFDSHSEGLIGFPDGLTAKQTKQEQQEFSDEFSALRNLPRLAERLSGRTLVNAFRQWWWYRIAYLAGDNPMYSGFSPCKPDITRQAVGLPIPTMEDLTPSSVVPSSMIPIALKRSRTAAAE